jgi:hypothetical protein
MDNQVRYLYSKTIYSDLFWTEPKLKFTRTVLGVYTGRFCHVSKEKKHKREGALTFSPRLAL